LKAHLTILAALVGLVHSPSAGAELTLFARYDWKDGARDVSGSPIVHDGVLEGEASVSDGKLVMSDWGGVDLGVMPELDGATVVLLRFEDVTFTELPEGATGRYSVLAGAGYDSWWVGVDFDLPPYGNRTALRFNLQGWGMDSYDAEVVVADDLVTHFDSIEYRYDGAAAPEERIAIRWNDGDWQLRGDSRIETVDTFSSLEYVRINDGGRADWDPMEAVLGPVSFYSSQVGPYGFQMPGDSNQDGQLDISDAVDLLGSLFLGDHSVLPCGDGTMAHPANKTLLDSNGDGDVDLSDAVHVLSFLFAGLPPPVLGTECTVVSGCPDVCAQ